MAAVGAVERDAIEALQHASYTIRPVYTGQRGGEFLFEVITSLTNIATSVWANKAGIEEVANDLGALVTICVGIVPIAQHIVRAHKRRVGTVDTAQQPIKITVEIDGAPISVEAVDLEQAEAALKLARQFHVSHPTIATQVSPQSRVKIRDAVPKKPRHRRR
jgi:hypothetical protein